jgi:hypothetical protein
MRPLKVQVVQDGLGPEGDDIADHSGVLAEGGRALGIGPALSRAIIEIGVG